MSHYYWFNRAELLKKAHDKYHNKAGKEKAAEYYQKKRNDKKERKRQVQVDE